MWPGNTESLLWKKVIISLCLMFMKPLSNLFAAGGSSIAGAFGNTDSGLKSLFGPLCCRTGTDLRPRGIATTSLMMLLAHGILVVYNEVIQTAKYYMRDVTAVESAWLLELAPHFYQQGTHLSLKAKRAKVDDH
ncbi:hypothetical protein llap_20666 [Limosa lapponica baueri]|uniref:DEAD-box helicase OB fold domain-containing protein n=1 Tax=Limosa lapponica baueri TaxID=1758121 RepID=A0A2I0T5G5_LIMLA|nr:hypothetical protein llap_20666 [Limosa lapponica baueri]